MADFWSLMAAIYGSPQSLPLLLLGKLLDATIVLMHPLAPLVPFQFKRTLPPQLLIHVFNLFLSNIFSLLREELKQLIIMDGLQTFNRELIIFFLLLFFPD